MNYRYGRKIGLAKLVMANMCDYLGLFSTYRNIRWSKAERLVFICQGNICRSAYAEARASQLMLDTASAGLGAVQDGAADSYAIKKAAERNINLNPHKTTPISSLVTKDGDVFLCMEPSQAYAVSKHIKDNHRQQVTLLGLWSTQRRPYLQDPYGLSDKYWDTCLDIIDSALENIAHMLPK